jgi:sigma-B regulation protein RsbU (phosphoserine phosphatase)
MVSEPSNADVDSSPPRIQCAEVWGGNHSVHTPVSLPGLRGMLFSRGCTGGRGGDLHYLSMCGSGLLSRVCIADVVGHGDEVAGVGREIHALLRRHTNWPDHRRMLRHLNRSLEKRGLKALTTAAVLTYYPPSQRLSFSYAGHPPGWYYSTESRAWRRLTNDQSSDYDDDGPITDCPLAVAPDAEFTRAKLRPKLGDRLLLITDGVLEAMDDANRHFGAERVARLLVDHCESDLGEIADALLRALTEHVGSSEFRHDDLSFLLLEFTPAPPGPALWHVVRNRFLRPLGLASAPNG